MYGGLNNWDPSVNNGADFTAPPVPELLVVGGTDNNGRIWTGVRGSPSILNLTLANIFLELDRKLRGDLCTRGRHSDGAIVYYSWTSVRHISL